VERYPYGSDGDHGFLSYVKMLRYMTLLKGIMDFLKPSLNTIYYNVEQFEF